MYSLPLEDGVGLVKALQRPGSLASLNRGRALAVLMAAVLLPNCFFLRSDLPINSLGLGNSRFISICASPDLVFKCGYATTWAVHWDYSKLGSVHTMKLM